MTKKHYEMIAEELKAAMELNYHYPEARLATERIIEGLANTLAVTTNDLMPTSSSWLVDWKPNLILISSIVGESK
jgi:hypothetical protein